MRPPQPERIQALNDHLNRRILVLDGAMGTRIQSENLSADDFGGPELEGCNENLVLTRPELIQRIHGEYLGAGCDIIETNSFGGTPLVLNEYGLGERAVEINKRAAEIARAAADLHSVPERPRFVAGSIGPTTKAISVTGGIQFHELQEHFYIQASGLLQGGVDFYLIETSQDTRTIKAALLAIDRLTTETGIHIPTAVSVTIEPTGTMLAGQSIEAVLTSLTHRNLLYLGLNCATGPEFMTDSIRSLAKLSPFRIACVPNAGLPDQNGCYLETAEMVGSVMERFISNGWINLIGGCCGTNSSHIRRLSELATRYQPRKQETVSRRSSLSGIDYLEITDEMRPILVGERTNVIGSKKFKSLICEEKFEEASEVARGQIKNGAHLIDVCLANPDRNELQDMRSFMEVAIRKIRAPLMIDSTDAKVIELALTYCQGKAIINSINLEDGEKRFDEVVPLAKKYGASLVVGTIDDDPAQGMGVSRDRKVGIAERSYEILTRKHGVTPEDIYWDPLVFPCATGDQQYVGSAVETIEGIRLIKQRFPGTKTVLGISNVSFGLPPAGREVLNSVFLYHCVQAGLDLAIVNSEKLERFAKIPDQERRLAEDLLFSRGGDPIAAFANHFRERKTTERKSRETLPLDERLARCILEGSKEGLIEDLNEALKTARPLQIINGPLMKGMDEVGRLFNANQLIVAEVLQSAEVMKAAVAHLEPMMEKTESSTRGKIVLATVKGDVHDIGKNLVDIILSNNGFQVIDLGIKVPPEQLIQAVREHEPDVIGLSGLLVKSAQQMLVTADDFAKAGIRTPMLVGGAALSSQYVDQQIAKAYPGTVIYASDAMSGLDLAKAIVDPEKYEELKTQLERKRQEVASSNSGKAEKNKLEETTKRSSTIPILDDLPSPPDLDRHVLRNTPIEQVWRYVNPLMLYGRHLGIKGSSVRLLGKAGLEERDPKAVSIWKAVQEVKDEFKGTEILQIAAVYQFFRATSHDNTLSIFHGGNERKFHFPRQRKEQGLCLADYTVPANLGRRDHVALFVVTCGKGIRSLVETMKNRGDYLKSHIIQALALETAEGYAEFIHGQIRKAWGFPDPPEMTMMERFQAKYRGKRYSFGYPACPRLDDQALLWELLNPVEIGVQLTDGMMMDPESSVSALVFHHPAATYFSVGQRGGSDGELTEDNRRS